MAEDDRDYQQPRAKRKGGANAAIGAGKSNGNSAAAAAGYSSAATTGSSGTAPPVNARRRRTGISARERNLRRLESNERERMRMHSLNDAFEVR